MSLPSRSTTTVNINGPHPIANELRSGSGQIPPPHAKVSAGEQQQLEAVVSVILITFRDAHGFELEFKMKPTIKMGRAMAVFRERTNTAVSRFQFQGEDLSEDETVKNLGMVDGDIVRVFYVGSA